MAGNITFDNTYQQRGAPGATTSAILRCTSWGPFQTYTHKPVSADDVDYSNTTLRGGNFRFLLLILGPTGSGKTAITKYLKRYAALINNVGVRDGAPWVVDSVSYDHIIQRDPDYRNDFNQIMQQARDARLAPEAPPPSGAARAVRQQQLGARVIGWKCISERSARLDRNVLTRCCGWRQRH